MQVFVRPELGASSNMLRDWTNGLDKKKCYGNQNHYIAFCPNKIEHSHFTLTLYAVFTDFQRILSELLFL